MCLGCQQPLYSSNNETNDNIITNKLILSEGRQWHQDCFKCSLCKNSFNQEKPQFYMLEKKIDKKFCWKCFSKIYNLVEKNIITDELQKKT